MIKSSDAYKEAVTGDSRRIFVRAIIDLADPNAEFLGQNTNSESKYSNSDQVRDKKYSVKKYATLESNRWKLDGSYTLYPEEKPTNEEIGYMSDFVSDENGVFATPVFFEMKFRNVSVLQTCSVYFTKNPDDGVPEDFTFSVIEGTTERYKQDFTGNKKTSVAISGFTVFAPTVLRLVVRKMSKPVRRLRISEMILGIYEEWGGDQLSAFSLKQQGDVSNVALPYGTCNITLDNADRRFEPRRKGGIFQSIAEQQKVEISMGVQLPDGSVEYKKMGDYYQKGNGWKTSDNAITIQWSLVDIVGLLADRIFEIPEVLPTTLEGWATEIVGQLGDNFKGRYRIDPEYKNKPVKANSPIELVGLTCGDLIRYAAMASETWARADNSTGFLTFEPLWNEGNKITLDNLEQYPTMSANKDISIMFFDMWDGKPPIALSGNSVSASDTVSVKNPFIHDKTLAMKAARKILSAYGGNQIQITGRGDMSSEIGDVDTIWLDESNATTARRTLQNFSVQGGILRGVTSTLVQADGVFTYEGKAVIKDPGTWTAPAGKTRLRVIVIGKGENGTNGTDGSFFFDGEDGVDGEGAKVWADTINVNNEQSFEVAFVGKDTLFGNFSSANGKRYPYGYTDVNSGDVYARTGVKAPLPGSGDGGRHGDKGLKEEYHTEPWVDDRGIQHNIVITDRPPTPGGKGVEGAHGSIVVYWEK